MLKRWPAFTRFLGDGRICLTNNAAERALRGIALGCKAWLFAGSDRGGERAAAMYVQVDDRPASETLHESRRSVVAAAASEFTLFRTFHHDGIGLLLRRCRYREDAGYFPTSRRLYHHLVHQEAGRLGGLT